MQEEEEYEDEMSRMSGGMSRKSDNVMRTPYRSITPIGNKNPPGQNQF